MAHEEKHSNEDASMASGSGNSSAASSSDISKRSSDRKRKSRKGKKRSAPAADDVAEAAPTSPIALNGGRPKKTFEQRRDSLSKAARDPRDQPPPKKKIAVAGAASTALTKQELPIIDHDGLSRAGSGTRQRRDETEEEAAVRFEKMRGAVKTILECVGEDPNREGLLDTPSRYAKALMYLTKGYQVNIDSLVNNALFHEGHNEMVTQRDIKIYSLCEHHLVPFIGKMHIGYIPRDTVIGLSKLTRIAKTYARRLQIQERLTKDVAKVIMEILKPQGVGVVMESNHLCMAMRGVEQTDTTTITSCVLGSFERNPKTRNEFLSLIGSVRQQ